MPIDTLKAAKRLQEDDTFSPEQAERIAELLSDLDVASATKDDLDDLEDRLGERIEAVEARMSERFEQIDERFEHAKEERESIEARLTQRIELSEERLGKKIERSEKRLLRWMITGLGTVAAVLGALMGLIGYLAG